jgi:hypothetical protein
VTWGVAGGDSGQEAVLAAARETGTWVAGQNYRQHPRSRGQAAVLTLSGSGTRRWAFERAVLVASEAGRQAKL